MSGVRIGGRRLARISRDQLLFLRVRPEPGDLAGFETIHGAKDDDLSRCQLAAEVGALADQVGDGLPDISSMAFGTESARAVIFA